ncbi:Glycosyltransferase family protein 64 protein C5 [Hibiscus syriacus]|uniref:Glycosyltransferase family protein 64 protein C5 n=1 Tax=Hibiscus syriacus TaxID=106335 RepID=A0A6A3BAE4_HIBSY|nr:Glycosyltransferase family protein 64 protein C5 [Hibiscus syriacus]
MVVTGDGENGGSGGSCCIKWWQHNRNHNNHVHHHHHNHSNNGSGNGNSRRAAAAGFFFCLFCFVIHGLIAVLYGWLVLTPPSSLHQRKGLPWLGCQEDNEGSWAIGVFIGQSPFSLKPIETAEIWKNESAAWPVANPVITCASASDSGFASNFVADPFLYVQGDNFYLFYETKNSYTMQGDIGVAKSIDKGATWQQLGIALDEEWHLSFPYVFNYLGQVYMMPESSEKGELRLYRVTNFPLEWELDRIIMKKPLVDSFIIDHDGEYWLFGSEHRYFGEANGQLEIWYSSSPLGPWEPHKKNPIYNTYSSFGARNGGRPFRYNGNLYRIGQDCGETYGRRVRIFQVEVLSRFDYKEVEVPFPFEESSKGRNAWNGARYHHLDVQQLRSGEWVGVMDGDRVPSGDSVHRLFLGCASVAAVAGLILLLGVLLGAVNCIVPLNWCSDYSGKRSDTLIAWERANDFSSKVRRVFSRLNRTPFLSAKLDKTKHLYWKISFGSGVCFRSCDFLLRCYVHLRRQWCRRTVLMEGCASVKEIVVVWNKGIPPKLSDLDSAVPVRIRVEDQNSLNNRFKIDPSIKTRAVLELDDDIMMPCDDIERGFMLWRQHPDRIVGFYPSVWAAFIDSQVAFERYWSKQAKVGREVVDTKFNCEDLLMNFLYANASSSKTVEYVRPAWAIDTSKLSTAAISRDTNTHYKIRSQCLRKFTDMYGSMSGRRWEFGSRKDHWDGTNNNNDDDEKTNCSSNGEASNNVLKSKSFSFRAPQENFSIDDFELGKIYGVGSYSKLYEFDRQ